VSGLDAERRRVRTDGGEEIGYDYLVLCCGVTANYFGIPGAEEHARTIYTRKAAIEVRDVLLGNLEAVAQDRRRPESRRRSHFMASLYWPNTAMTLKEI
jgi:NADH:ubiquinone reductase (H+-translocating)